MSTNNTRLRRFMLKGGFRDATDYIETVDGRSFIVRKEGLREETDNYPLSVCERYVADGDWVELDLVCATAAITEAQVVDWLQAQREKHGLTCLQLMIHAPIEAKPKIHGGIPARASVFAHTTDQLGNGESISEALTNLHETTN